MALLFSASAYAIPIPTPQCIKSYHVVKDSGWKLELRGATKLSCKEAEKVTLTYAGYMDDTKVGSSYQGQVWGEFQQGNNTYRVFSTQFMAPQIIGGAWKTAYEGVYECDAKNVELCSVVPKQKR